MPTYGLAIDIQTGIVSQFNHASGAFVRHVCELDPDWTASVSDFDTTTGLPMDGTIDETGTSVPCSIAASEDLWYLYDTYTCRVLAIDPATAALFATFGGRRGIGAGRITLDGTPRSICQVANGKFWLTDNAGDFVVRYSLFGTFEAEHSISGWATALSLAFDQVTGWAYDTARGVYWALAQSSTTAYLFAVTTAGVATGEVIDLTARLSVPGHNNSPSDRVRTRGLHYHNGRLLLFSEGNALLVDLTNTDGDATLVAEANDLSPGNWSSDGAEVTHVLRDQPNGVAVVYVRDADGVLLRSYGLTFTPPDGEDGHLATPWDVTVAPTAEDPSARTTRGLSLRARITAVASQAMQMRACIANAVTQTLSMRARILNLGPFGSQQTFSMRAAIEEPSTVPDGVAVSWELTDSLGEYSRGLTLQARGRAGFQVGDTLTLYAGYGVRRVKIFHGEIDDIVQDLTTDQEAYTFTLRDVGASTLDRRLLTRTWTVQFPTTEDDIPSVSAATVLQDAAVAGGVTLEGIGFPDYPLYGNFVANNETAQQVASRLAEPWTQFASRQYLPQVRDGELRMVPINWANPPEDGYQVTRGWVTQMTRKQTRYLGSPDLTSFTGLQVKGTTISLSILDTIGPQTRVEYFRNLVEEDAILSGSEGDDSVAFAAEYVLTENISTEEVWGDHVLSRVAETYETRFTNMGVSGGTSLIAREEETCLYFEPFGELGFSSIQMASAGPSPLALPLQTNNVTSGIDPTDGVFKELNRVQTTYQYDNRFQLAVETTSTNIFDTATQNWTLDSVQHRTHSETTGGSTRIRKYDFTNADGVLAYDGSDSQQVGGGRPDPSAISANRTVVTFQAIAPLPEVIVDIGGQAIAVDPGPDRILWTYENAFLGQNECESILALAFAEKGLQTTHKEDEVTVTGPLDVNLRSGMGASVEIAASVFEDYWVASVVHSFDTQQAVTRATFRRLTTEGFS